MSETVQETAPTTIELTASAAARVRQVMQQKPEIAGLRLGVQGGGCSGFSYVIQFETVSRPKDHVFEFEGARVFVDPKSLVYLKGMRVDYKADLMQQGFVLHNPNAKQTCGCGTSFSA
jgi:iron-sulfur cluster assembly protein